jgi:HK97 family phage major capsid protein
MSVSIPDPEIQNALSEKLTTDDLGVGGLMPREVQEEFIDLVVGEAELLDTVSRTPRPRRRMRQPRIDMDEFARRGRGEEAEVSKTGLDFENLEIDCVEGSTSVDVTQEMIEEAVNSDDLADMIMDRLATRFGRATQALGILGDEGAATEYNRAPPDFRQQNDGFLRKAADSSMPQFANEDDSGNSQPISMEALGNMDGQFPDEYRSTVEPVYMMSHDNYRAIRSELGDDYDTAGYAAVMGEEEFTPHGHDIATFDYWPNDQVILTGPLNLDYSYFNEMEVETLTSSDATFEKRLEMRVKVWADDDFVIKNPYAGVLMTDIASS